jgi:hypothetical protein
LLKGDRVFTLQLQNSDYVVGKVEKGFEFASTANNRRMGFQSPTLATYTSKHLLHELIKLGYLVGYDLEFIGVAKRTLEQNTAKVTVVLDTTKQYLLQTSIYILGNKVIIQIPSLEPSANPLGPEALTTTILVRGIPIELFQTQINVVLHRLLGAKNIVVVTFNRAQDDPMGRHEVWLRYTA